MYSSKLRPIGRSRKIYRSFGGYHHSQRIGAGEFYETENLSSRAYPLLTAREPRRRISEEPVSAMACLNGLCYVSQGTLYFGDKELVIGMAYEQRQLIPFGAYLIVLPDKLWVNTLDGSHGSCEQKDQYYGSMGIVWCDETGEPLETVVDGDTAPENTAQFWLDTSVTPPRLRRWSALSGAWEEEKPTYLRINYAGLGADFPKGKRITLLHDSDLLTIFHGKVHEVLAGEKDYIVLQGSMPYIRRELHEIQFEVIAPMPKMDFVIEHENRLWGCRYGENNNGDFVNEIYASKLGDFTDWSSFDGISTDSYVASCGTEGPWTGAICAQGYPVFFKETVLHKVYGSRPGNYRISTQPCIGVAKGCHRSLAAVNTVVYYKGTDGIYAYDGSLPLCVSEDLGAKPYGKAVAGAVQGRYYCSMEDEEGSFHLFCYDTKRRLWHREDGVQGKEFCTVGNVLYFTAPNGLWVIGGKEGQPEGPVRWYAVSGLMGAEEPDGKYLAALQLRLSLEPGARLRVLAQYDSGGGWESLGEISGIRLRSKELPLRPKRCDHLRLRLEGEGDFLLHSLTVTMEGE